MATDKQASFLWTLVTAYPVEAARIGFNSREYRNADTIRTGIRAKEASNIISALVSYASVWPWRPTSRQAIAAEIAYQMMRSSYPGRTFARQFYGRAVAQASMIGFQGDFAPLVFSKNVNGERIPVSMVEAEESFRKMLSVVKDKVNARLKSVSSEDRTAPDIIVDEVDDEPETENESVEPEPEVVVVDEKETRRREAEDLLRFINNAHAMTEDLRDPVTGNSFDSIGFRWYIPSAELFVQGVDPQIIKANLTRTWPLENKRALWSEQGVKFRNGVYVADSDMSRSVNPWDYDPTNFKPNPNLPGMQFVTQEDHKAIGLALTYLNTTKLCWLIGPPGTGKTHMVGGCAEKFGKELDTEFPYVVLSLTRATSPSAFYGKQRIDGTAFLIDYLDAQANNDEKRAAEVAKRAREYGDVLPAIFERICRDGGIIGLDEADRADPNTMQMLNAVIAQRIFVNTVAQTSTDLHPDTMFMMMTNTEGTGANRAHNTADKMDDATVDRFRAVRMFVGLDKELATRKFRQIIEASL